MVDEKALAHVSCTRDCKAQNGPFVGNGNTARFFEKTMLPGRNAKLSLFETRAQTRTCWRPLMDLNKPGVYRPHNHQFCFLLLASPSFPSFSLDGLTLSSTIV